MEVNCKGQTANNALDYHNSPHVDLDCKLLWLLLELLPSVMQKEKKN